MRASLLASAIASTLWCPFGRLDPGLEPMALPALGLDQHNPCRLHEQDPQVAIAALGYLAQDRTIAGRHLPWDEPQPGGEVPTFGEGITSPDRGHHRAGDDRPNAGHAHQPLAAGVRIGQNADLR
jgi:hypothetical protein